MCISSGSELRQSTERFREFLSVQSLYFKNLGVQIKILKLKVKLANSCLISKYLLNYLFRLSAWKFYLKLLSQCVTLIQNVSLPTARSVRIWPNHRRDPLCKLGFVCYKIISFIISQDSQAQSDSAPKQTICSPEAHDFCQFSEANLNRTNFFILKFDNPIAQSGLIWTFVSFPRFPVVDASVDASASFERSGPGNPNFGSEDLIKLIRLLARRTGTRNRDEMSITKPSPTQFVGFRFSAECSTPSAPLLRISKQSAESAHSTL